MPTTLPWTASAHGVDADAVAVRVDGRADPTWWGGTWDGTEEPAKVVVVAAVPDGAGAVLAGLAATWAECRWANAHPAVVAASLVACAQAPPGLWPGIGCAHVVIVTADRQVVLTRRSEQVAFYPGAWSASCEEQLEASVDRTVGDAARRAVAEEFGVPAAAVAGTRVLDVVRERTDAGAPLGVYAVVAVEVAATASELAAASAVDAWERDRLVFVPASVLAAPGGVPERPGGWFGAGPGGRWHPTARHRLSALSRFLAR